ncbi:unnamed protein product, partial [Rotaria magnacalcarata]
KFLRLHPDYKDKSGFWGTTLLYSAARGGFIDLVTYLVETVSCSVNAQNQRELAFALITDNDTDRQDPAILGYDPDPKLAAT